MLTRVPLHALRHRAVAALALKILEAPCDGCPFKGRFEGLRAGRLRDIVEECEEGEGSYFACHKTVYDTPDSDGSSDAVFGPAWVCAGWLEVAETRGRIPAVIQIAERLGFVHRGSPEEPPA